MELFKNIFFNTDKLIEDNTVKISYMGYFFQKNSEKVYLHYGFDDEWKNVSDIEMEKTELGFQAEIHLDCASTLNLCFRDNNEEWDNRFGQNFSFPIEKKSVELIVLEDEPMFAENSKRLRKSYLLNKKFKLAVYKIVTYIPKMISGNKRKRIANT